MLDLPPLAPALTRMRTVVGLGTLLWLVAAAAASVAILMGSALPPLVLTTCVVGAALGGIGWAVFAWQRSAARRVLLFTSVSCIACLGLCSIKLDFPKIQEQWQAERNADE